MTTDGRVEAVRELDRDVGRELGRHFLVLDSQERASDDAGCEELLRDVWGFRSLGRTRTLESHAPHLITAEYRIANRPPDPAEGATLDPRCLTGRTLCIDKSSNSLRWVVDGDVMVTLDVRFGREGMETREGQFAVSYKSRDHVSSIYDTSMPFAMFFSGGQAVHYSPDFAANGYNGASHGCVNVRDKGTVAALFAPHPGSPG